MNFGYDGLMCFSEYINFLLTIYPNFALLFIVLINACWCPDISTTQTAQKCLQGNIQEFLFALACIRAAVQYRPESTAADSFKGWHWFRSAVLVAVHTTHHFLFILPVCLNVTACLSCFCPSPRSACFQLSVSRSCFVLCPKRSSKCWKCFAGLFF